MRFIYRIISTNSQLTICGPLRKRGAFQLDQNIFYKIKGNETRLALIVQVAVFDRFVWYRSQKLFAHSLILKRRMVWFCFFKVMHAYIGIPTKKIYITI